MSRFLSLCRNSIQRTSYNQPYHYTVLCTTASSLHSNHRYSYSYISAHIHTSTCASSDPKVIPGPFSPGGRDNELPEIDQQAVGKEYEEIEAAKEGRSHVLK